jgi:parallel beta-helix repeat protein
MANKEVSLFDKCLVVLLVVAVAGIVLLLANSLMAKPPAEPKIVTEEAKPAGLACPPPSVAKDGICILESDATLDKTLRLPSRTTLDCQGHKLVPAKEGKEASQTNPSTPSVPVAGIFLNSVTGATVQNCVLEGFDFGVVITDGKDKKPNNIINNTISSLYQGVTIIEADNNIIRGNTIEFHNGGSGAGVLVWQDSDFNNIQKNTITSPSTASVFPGPGYPGGKDIALIGAAFPVDAADPGSVAGLTGGTGMSFYSVPEILDFQIENITLQFVRNPTDRAEGNTIDENMINIKGNPNLKRFSAGIEIGSFQKGTIIRKNIITEGTYGVKLTPFEDLMFGLNVTQNAYPRDILIENNQIEGKFETAGIALRESINSIVRGNTVRLTKGNAEKGVVIAGPALETATVTRNHIDGFKFGIRLALETFFGYTRTILWCNGFTQ